MLSALGQIALNVTDADRSERFYGETLGLPKLFRFGDLVFFDCAGVRLMLEGTAKESVVIGDECHYFTVQGIEAAYQELKARGVAMVDEPHVVAKMPDHELWMVFFRDPDGHLLALMEEKR
ncbi:MAG: VOC family protein [Fimbriimonadaceae bacterium]|nr:VOC family protein [Fimbriimonadaceae bacterium]